ncbi:ABC transporter ATP-binding protein [Martelella mediterranea]|uniref:Putative osmoprotectant uptake system ATP-binding protein YehX n=1 Tax=Martelella mediterranea DSM 17316 TaxID=1122214 RepID=A0A1U9YXE5_9HYPH|nr:ABC transporter ATP-binding protein [Martelella mediterranea]AQZ50104.1 Putative osmoprotectant uptake system ATP-binding protein YehX [Martelella mediterranea DSM 17316]
MIEIDGITKVYGKARAVDNVSLTVERGELAAIVGTSGSGKTTLMRMINRLVEPTSGTIRIDGRDNRDLPAYELRRGIGYAIQGHGLFPHRTVAENIATVPKLLGWDRKKRDDRVDELLTLFNLEPELYRDRMPQELSGGQKQRIGVARALAAEPALLLMDEPFGALDPIIRAKAQEDLLKIQRQFSTTVVLVTHDMDEAILLGHRIGVMHEGKLLQYAPPAEIIAHPASDFVNELLGTGDKAFRMLSLTAASKMVEEGPAEGPPIADTASLRDALAQILWTGRDAVPVARDGVIIGRITRERLLQRAEGPAS